MKSHKAYKMYEFQNNNQSHFGIAGYYHFADEYMCIWLGDSNTNFTNTIHHEVCHHLINKDEKGHFCDYEI